MGTLTQNHLIMDLFCTRNVGREFLTIKLSYAHLLTAPESSEHVLSGTMFAASWLQVVATNDSHEILILECPEMSQNEISSIMTNSLTNHTVNILLDFWEVFDDYAGKTSFSRFSPK